jgi:hypothetical protein
LAWGVGIAATLWWSLCALGGFLDYTREPRGNESLLLSLALALMAVPSLARPALWSRGSAGRVVAPLVLGAAAPALAVTTFACGAWTKVAASSGLHSAPVLGCGALLILGWSLLVVGGAWAVRRKISESLVSGDTAVPRLMVALVMAGSLALIAMACGRAFGRPSMSYVEQLPEVAVFAPLPGASTSLESGDTPPAPETRSVAMRDGQPTEVSRSCGAYSCKVAIAGRDRNGGRVVLLSSVARTERVELRLDEPLGLLLARARRSVGAYDIALHREADVGLREVAGRVAPPARWALGAAAALLAAVALQLQRARLARVVALLSAGHAARLRAGVIALRGSQTEVLLPSGITLSDGPVVVVPTAVRAGSPYREGSPLGEFSVFPGSLEALTRKAHANVLALDLASLAVAALGAAPLAGAFLLRLV